MKNRKSDKESFGEDRPGVKNSIQDAGKNKVKWTEINVLPSCTPAGDFHGKIFR
jgi:hypothetical protein